VWPPTAPEQQPAINAQKGPDALHVLNEVVCGVAFQGCKGRGAATAALIEEDNTEAFGVEEAPRGGVTARAGAAMDNKNRYPLRVTGLFQVEECPSPTSRRWVA